jgi:hypothetical protein
MSTILVEKNVQVLSEADVNNIDRKKCSSEINLKSEIYELFIGLEFSIYVVLSIKARESGKPQTAASFTFLSIYLRKDAQKQFAAAKSSKTQCFCRV